MHCDWFLAALGSACSLFLLHVIHVNPRTKTSSKAIQLYFVFVKASAGSRSFTEGFSFRHPKTRIHEMIKRRRLECDLHMSAEDFLSVRDSLELLDVSLSTQASFLHLQSDRIANRLHRSQPTGLRDLPIKATCGGERAKSRNLCSLRSLLAARARKQASPSFYIKSTHNKDIQIIPLKLFNAQTFNLTFL